MEDYRKKIIIVISIYVALKVFFIGLIPMLAGLGGGGFEREEVLTKFMFYTGPGIAFVLGVVALAIFAMFYFKKDETTINGIFIHNPEKSIIPKFLTNPLNLIFIFLILTSILGLLTTVSQATFFTQIPHVEQQVTETAEISFSMYPASPAENAGLEFVCMLALVGLGVFYKRHNIPKNSYIFFAIPIVLILAVSFGLINHSMRYGFDEVAMGNVAFFWGLSGFLILLFGSVIPAQIMHDINNLFSKLNEMFSSEIVVNVIIALIVLLVITYVFILLLKGKRNGKIKDDKS